MVSTVSYIINPHHPTHPFLSLISTLHTELAGWRGEGPLKAVEVVLKSSLKGASLRGGGSSIFNRTERGGERGFFFLREEDNSPTYPMVNAGGGRAYVSILPVRPGGGVGL